MKPHYINVQPMHAHVFYSFLNGMNTGGLIVGSGSPGLCVSYGLIRGSLAPLSVPRAACFHAPRVCLFTRCILSMYAETVVPAACYLHTLHASRLACQKLVLTEFCQQCHFNTFVEIGFYKKCKIWVIRRALAPNFYTCCKTPFITPQTSLRFLQLTAFAGEPGWVGANFVPSTSHLQRLMAGPLHLYPQV